jgi:hypothetical protein
MFLKRLGCAVPVIAMTLAGCAESARPVRYTYIYTAPAPPVSPPVVPSFVPRAEAAAAPPRINDPPPLRPVDPDPPAPWHWPSWRWPSWASPAGASAPSADDGTCTGWWSICHFFPR